METVILFSSHIVNNETINRYLKIREGIPQNIKIVWCLNKREGEVYTLPKDIEVFEFTKEDFQYLPYTVFSEDIWFNANLIMMLFYLQNPRYDFYWFIEYDVIFTGSWDLLFCAFADTKSDLISSHVERYSNANTSWQWWDVIELKDKVIPIENRLKSFNPVYRLSHRALSFLHECLSKGNAGYYEVLMPTILYDGGFTLEDFGGTGDFVKPGNRNRFYIQGTYTNYGTMRYFPNYSREEINALGTANKLFHPIK